MQIDWRGLLSEIRVQWRDRGANVSKGNINVACPWCQNDPSFHMGISEAREAHYCFREPNRHSGTSFIRLLMGLGVNRNEALRLLNRYKRGVAVETEKPRKSISLDSVSMGWSRFQSATQSPACLEYLASRGFPNPADTAARYDLRFAREGSWARRLLIPISNLDGKVMSWTGRALIDLKPKYLALETHPDPYLPSLSKPPGSVLVIVEGTMDALKGHDACRRSIAGQQFVFVALHGKSISPPKLLMLRELAKGCDGALLALDSDVTLASIHVIKAELASAIKLRYIGRARLPRGFNDPADMPAGEIPIWLSTALKDQLALS